jgi:hypothetical protein
MTDRARIFDRECFRERYALLHMKGPSRRTGVTGLAGVTRFGGVAVLAALAGCGDGAAKLEPLSACTDAWQPITQPAPNDISLAPVAFANGNVYYSTFKSQGVFAQPVAGGAPTMVAAVSADWLTVQGDALIYTTGDFGSQFFSVPLAGGPPTLMFDGSVGRSDVGAALLIGTTPTDFVWTEVGDAFASPWTVWRVPQTGGTATMLGTVSAKAQAGDELGFSGMAVGDDSVVLGSILGIADAVPLAGGASVVLAAPKGAAQGADSLAGVDATGAYWASLRAGAPSEDDEWDLTLSPADGSPTQTFWQGLPAHASFDDIWPDGAGGWIITAAQMFDDQRFHTTVWSLAADKKTAKRLACSPGFETDALIERAPAITPDAVYVMTQSQTWQLVRIAR